jgi:hypothetical protein
MSISLPVAATEEPSRGIQLAEDPGFRPISPKITSACSFGCIATSAADCATCNRLERWSDQHRGPWWVGAKPKHAVDVAEPSSIAAPPLSAQILRASSQNGSSAARFEISILTAAVWARGEVVAPLTGGTRLFDWVRATFEQGITLHDALVPGVSKPSPLARFSGRWIEAVVDFAPPVAGDPRLVQPRSYLGVRAHTASGVVITGCLVVPKGADLPEVTGESTDLRIMLAATLQRNGVLLAAEASVLLNLGRVALISVIA